MGPLGLVSNYGFYTSDRVGSASLEEGVEMIKPRPSSHYDFTEDWFSFRAELWARFLSPLAGRPHLHFAEVGVFEGRSTIWLLEHVLTNPSSRIDCIDPFEWISRHGPVSIDMAEVERRFHANIEAAAGGDRVRLIRARSQEAPSASPRSCRSNNEQRGAGRRVQTSRS